MPASLMCQTTNCACVLANEAQGCGGNGGIHHRGSAFTHAATGAWQRHRHFLPSLTSTPRPRAPRFHRGPMDGQFTEPFTFRLFMKFFSSVIGETLSRWKSRITTSLVFCSRSSRHSPASTAVLEESGDNVLNRCSTGNFLLITLRRFPRHPR